MKQKKKKAEVSPSTNLSIAPGKGSSPSPISIVPKPVRNVKVEVNWQEGEVSPSWIELMGILLKLQESEGSREEAENQ